MRYRYILSTIGLLFFFICVACTGIRSGNRPEKIIPEAVGGVLDLSLWDFLEDGPITLNGEWDFYWKSYVPPSDFLKEKTVNQAVYMQVPGPWYKNHVKKKKFFKEGYATYHLKVKLKKESLKLAFKFMRMGNAYRFFVNNELITGAGLAGPTKKTTIPMIYPHLITFESATNELDLAEAEKKNRSIFENATEGIFPIYAGGKNNDG
jgi:hypothetical protein